MKNRKDLVILGDKEKFIWKFGEVYQRMKLDK